MVLAVGAGLVGCSGLIGRVKDYQTGIPWPCPTTSPGLPTLRPQPTQLDEVRAIENTPQVMTTKALEPATMSLTIVYDNNPDRPGLETDWGFSALVQTGPDTVLFDTEKRGSILLSDLRTLDYDLESIDAVPLSHAHGDHTGGLQTLLDHGIRPDVYLLPSFSAGQKARLRQRTEAMEVEPAQQIAPRIYTTGEIAGDPPEQALVLDTQGKW